jgi:decaprenylphospho-beta-D-ribofuranose 2-oxidase
LPGYPTITVGGCIAFDIHGKSQFHSGNFGGWVEQLELFHRDHGLLVCSREREREVFELTVGGAGWTGVIMRARLRTTSLPGHGVELVRIPVGDLREAADVLRAEANDAASLYSWNDLNRRGGDFGCGVIYKECFVDEAPKARAARSALDVRTRFPWCSWNRVFTSPILGAYGRLQRRLAPRVLPLDTALFPIHGKEYYFAAFGRRGFREYQLIVPFERWPAFVEALRALLAQSGVPVTLGSLKLFDGAPSLLRFQMPGICLAMDVPSSTRTDFLWSRLDELAIASRSLVNLSKDSRLSATLLERLFPEYDVLRRRLQCFDPKRRCRSRLRDQVGV